jgi:hypothetical protein
MSNPRRKTPSDIWGVTVVETCGVLSGVDVEPESLQATKLAMIASDKDTAMNGRLCKLMK